MMDYLLPAACFLPMAAGAACFFAGKRSLKAMYLIQAAACAAALALCLCLFLSGGAALAVPGICGLSLNFRSDGFRGLYAVIAAFMWLMTGLFSPRYFAHHHRLPRYALMNLLTFGATLGLFLSDDLYTAFIFFEIMSFASFALVIQEETEGALGAANLYLAVAVIGGLTALMGLFLLWRETGTLFYDGIRAALGSGPVNGKVTWAAWLITLGFGAKAGLFPLHIWLPKAHPVAPAPASALLSGVLTKTGVFGLIVVCARIMPANAAYGNALLILAVITMALGAVLALFSTDLKRTLACSSMSQIGFITVGLSMMVLLGHEGALAAYGAVTHMVNHSLIKLTLFLAAGTVYMNTHQLNLNDIRGFGRKKPLLHISFLLGALAIGGVPFLGSGYHSKSLLHESILELIAVQKEHGAPWLPYKCAEILFLVSGGLTVAYMTKLYICIFWQKHPARQAEFDRMNGYLTPLSAFALLGSALVLPILSFLPGATLRPLADGSAAFFGQGHLEHAIHWFSGENLLGAAESLSIGALVYLLIVRKWLMKKEAGSMIYLNRWPERLDLVALLYRPLVMDWLPGILSAVTGFLARLPESKLIQSWIPRAVTAVTRFFADLPEGKGVSVVLPRCVLALVRLAAELPERIALFFRRTLFRPRRAARSVPVGNKVTWYLGLGLNGCARLLNRTLLRRHPLRTDFEYLLAASWRGLKDSVSALTVSVSFGLLLLCVGLYITCICLLW